MLLLSGGLIVLEPMFLEREVLQDGEISLADAQYVLLIPKGQRVYWELMTPKHSPEGT